MEADNTYKINSHLVEKLSLFFNLKSSAFERKNLVIRYGTKGVHADKRSKINKKIYGVSEEEEDTEDDEKKNKKRKRDKKKKKKKKQETIY